jgi:hypothetical protein
MRLTPPLLATLLLSFPAHATTLAFYPDSYTYIDPQEPSLSMTVELHDLDAATNTFQLTASGTIGNYLYYDEFTYYPDAEFRIMLLGERDMGAATVSLVDWSIPSGLSVIPEEIGGRNEGEVLVNGYRATVNYPTPADPFDWMVTLEVTVPDTLVGDYYLYNGWSRSHAAFVEGDWWHVAGYGGGDRDFFFSILPIPEPRSALLLAAGFITLSIYVRRT